MDIQRGDQVYYRGEVWTVSDPGSKYDPWRVVYLYRSSPDGMTKRTSAYASQVQRVEQVR